MPNQFDMVCPSCGDDDELDVKAQAWVRLTDDGTDADESHDGGHEWGDESECHCAACGWSGTAKDATPNDNAEEEEQS